jgi:hypothetical protein
MTLPNAPFYRRWSFILAGVIGVAAITALLGWRGLQQVDPPATTGTTQPATTVASPTTTTPRPSIEPTSKPTAALWDIQSGKGTATSPGFRAPAAWRIVWSFDCSNFKKLGGGNFKITGTGAFDRVEIQELDVRASGTRTFTRGGFGHLLVDSVCKRWSVTVLPG